MTATLRSQIEQLRLQLEQNKQEYTNDLTRLKDRYKHEIDNVLFNKDSVLANLEEKQKHLRKQ